MLTVAPGWPNPYSSHDVSTNTIIRSDLITDGSEQKQLATGKVATEIGMPSSQHRSDKNDSCIWYDFYRS